MTLSLDRLRELRADMMLRTELYQSADVLLALDDLIRRIEADRYKPASKPPNNGRDVLVKLRDGQMSVTWYNEKAGWMQPRVAEWRELPEAAHD